MIDQKPCVIGRRPTPSQAATEDEPFAWEAREFLRQLTVGKHVLGHVVHTANRKSAHPVLAKGDIVAVPFDPRIRDPGWAKNPDPG